MEKSSILYGVPEFIQCYVTCFLNKIKIHATSNKDLSEDCPDPGFLRMDTNVFY